jgi:hypothetical protein
MARQDEDEAEGATGSLLRRGSLNVEPVSVREREGEAVCV